MDKLEKLKKFKPIENFSLFSPDKEALNLKIENNEDLVFNSRFESGNLLQAKKVRNREYDLILSTDTNNSVYTQWYYFSVRNMSGP